MSSSNDIMNQKPFTWYQILMLVGAVASGTFSLTIVYHGITDNQEDTVELKEEFKREIEVLKAANENTNRRLDTKTKRLEEEIKKHHK